MVRDYISRVHYIQALQYTGTNIAEIVSWLGSQRCYITDNILRVQVDSSSSPIKLILGDYIVKDDGKISVIPEKVFNRQYENLIVSLSESVKALI